MVRSVCTCLCLSLTGMRWSEIQPISGVLQAVGQGSIYNRCLYTDIGMGKKELPNAFRLWQELGNIRESVSVA